MGKTLMVSKYLQGVILFKDVDIVIVPLNIYNACLLEPKVLTWRNAIYIYTTSWATPIRLGKELEWSTNDFIHCLLQ